MHNSQQIISQKARELQAEINKLPGTAKNLGLQFFITRFRAQGWRDDTFKPWAKRKRTDKRRPGRAILMDRGRLRSSIRARVSGPDVIFGTDVPYARIHNEGGTIKRHARSELFVRNRYKRGAKGKMFGGMGAFKKGTTPGKGMTFRAHEVRMPKRQFMGESKHLNNVITRKIQTTITKVFPSK